MSSINILIADDHTLFRQGLREICEMKGGFNVVGEAADGQQAVTLAQQLQPDVILMDIQMPELDGVQATKRILADNPHMRIIFLTMYKQDKYAFDAIEAGARGYLLKDAHWQELIKAIEVVYRGDALLTPEMTARLLDRFRRFNREDNPQSDALQQLTANEMSVLKLVAQGADNAEISQTLSLSEKTITNRLTTIYRKLNVSNRTQAALYALKQGWASLDENNSTP
jgi:DNA-binding NarL/FixJ family response regulator